MTDYDKIVLILRRATGISEEIAKLMADAYDDVLQELDLSESYLNNKQKIVEIFSNVDLQKEFNARLVSIGEATVKAHTKLKPIKITKKLVSESLDIVMGEVNASINDLIKRTGSLSVSSVQNYTKQAIDNGWTRKELVSALGKSEKMVKRHIATVATTSVNAVSNSAKLKLYNANSDMIDRVLFSATFDSNTTNICKNLDGKVFKLKDAPQLPLHPNERSHLVNILIGEDAEQVKKDLLPRPAVEPKSKEMYEKLGLTTRTGKTRSASRTDKSPLKGTQSKSENYESWLRKQPAYYQRDIIGVKASKKFRQGARLKDVINTSPITEELLNKAI